MRGSRTASLATVVVLTGAIASFAVPATGDQIRTDTGLGGFTVSTDAAPFKVQLDDPANPIPRPLDGPIVEANPAYTEADLDTGPTSRGIGSFLWPGGLLGEGLTQVAPGAPSYPLKAEGRYPDKPYEQTLQDNGALIKGSAKGLDVFGYAKANPADVPGTITLGTVTSTSTATVTPKDVAVGTSVSRVSDVSLLAGIIKVGSVSTTLSTESDGKKATSSGTTVVSGLTIAGVGYAVDDKGAHLVGPVSQGTGPLSTGAADPAKALGITVGGIGQTQTGNANSATRDAKGLRITVDTVVLRGVLNNVPSQVTGALYSIFQNAPAQVRGYLFYSLTTTPKITFILGASRGSVAATRPLSFSFPPLPNSGFPPVPGSVPGGAAQVPVTGPASGGVPVVPAVPAPDQAVAVAPPLTPSSSSGAPPGPFQGISGLLLLGAALAAGFGGWFLLRVQSLALGGGLLGGGCALGAPSDLPDLRGVTP